MVNYSPWILSKTIRFFNMSFRVYFFIYSGRTYRNCSFKLFYWYCVTRYLLCSSSFSLCVKNRSCVCFNRGICKLIPSNNWVIHKPYFIKGSIFSNIFRGKYNIFSYTLSRVSRNATTLLWLPRFLCRMKFYFKVRVNSISYSFFNIYFYFMRKNSKTTVCNV